MSNLRQVGVVLPQVFLTEYQVAGLGLEQAPNGFDNQAPPRPDVALHVPAAGTVAALGDGVEFYDGDFVAGHAQSFVRPGQDGKLGIVAWAFESGRGRAARLPRAARPLGASRTGPARFAPGLRARTRTGLGISELMWVRGRLLLRVAFAVPDDEVDAACAGCATLAAALVDERASWPPDRRWTPPAPAHRRRRFRARSGCWRCACPTSTCRAASAPTSGCSPATRCSGAVGRRRRELAAAGGAERRRVRRRVRRRTCASPASRGRASASSRAPFPDQAAAERALQAVLVRPARVLAASPSTALPATPGSCAGRTATTTPTSGGCAARCCCRRASTPTPTCRRGPRCATPSRGCSTRAPAAGEHGRVRLLGLAAAGRAGGGARTSTPDLARVRELLLDLLAPEPGWRVVDLGAGPGRLRGGARRPRLPARRSSTSRRSMLEHARERLGERADALPARPTPPRVAAARRGVRRGLRGAGAGVRRRPRRRAARGGAAGAARRRSCWPPTPTGTPWPSNDRRRRARAAGDGRLGRHEARPLGGPAPARLAGRRGPGAVGAPRRGAVSTDQRDGDTFIEHNWPHFRRLIERRGLLPADELDRFDRRDRRRRGRAARYGFALVRHAWRARRR